MKHIYLIIVLFVCAAAYGQKCTPDQSLTNPGIYPNPFPSAIAGSPYNEVMHFVFPRDTFDFTIDSVRIMQVTGMPQGFTYVCDTPTCSYVGGGRGCITISGNPTENMAGRYYVKITLSVSFSGLPPATMTDSIPFDIHSPNSARRTAPANEFRLFPNNPNPFNHKTEISFNLPKAQNVEFKVFDLLGNLVHEQQVKGKSGMNSLNFYADNLPSGFYLYQVSYDGKIFTRRLCVRKE